MTDPNTSISQLTLLQQKLHSAKMTLEEVHEDRNAKLQTLLQLIGHLSLACKGQNLELDNKLAKLRHNLTTFERIDEALPELNDIERLLKGQYNHIMQQLEESRVGLTQVIRQIQRVDSAPEKLKKEVNYLKQDIAKPFHTVWEYIPKVKQVLSFYDAILQLQFSGSEKLDVLPKHRLLADELAYTIAEIQFRQDQRSQVRDIQKLLATELEVEGLLEAYHSVLGLLLDNFAREKSASQEFLYALNDALSAVHEVVSDSYNHNQRSYQLKTQLNQDIQSRMQNAGQLVAHMEDSVGLKTQLMEQLGSIRTSLERKETLEQREQALLRKSMETMRKELNELSKEAYSYQERLYEQQKLNQLDPLTQLPNRAALEERMELEYRNYQRNKTSLWIAIADIDYFKSINDNFGHSTGDKALQVIAMAVKNSLKENEFVARYGGEEFVLLLPGSNEAEMNQQLNRLREKLKNIPFKFKNQRITITVSIGAAQVVGNEPLHETFERADAALYKAKHDGRDKVVIDL